MSIYFFFFSCSALNCSLDDLIPILQPNGSVKLLDIEWLAVIPTEMSFAFALAGKLCFSYKVYLYETWWDSDRADANVSNLTVARFECLDNGYFTLNPYLFLTVTVLVAGAFLNSSGPPLMDYPRFLCEMRLLYAGWFALADKGGMFIYFCLSI